MTPPGRNRYILELGIELTMPLDTPRAAAAAALLANDIRLYLKDVDWGFGLARIESVYTPQDQFQHGDFHPEDEKS